MLITNILRAALALTIVACHASAFAQQKIRSSELTINSVLQEEVSAYEIELRDPAKTKLKLHPEPVLSWVNPVRLPAAGFGVRLDRPGQGSRDRRSVHELLLGDQNVYNARVSLALLCRLAGEVCGEGCLASRKTRTQFPGGRRCTGTCDKKASEAFADASDGTEVFSAQHYSGEQSL